MQKIINLTFVLVLLFFTSCQKDEFQFCEEYHTGNFRVVNTQNDPYTIYLDNLLLGTVGANNSQSFTRRKSQSYSFKAVQASGYIFTPSIYTTGVTITDCNTTTTTLN